MSRVALERHKPKRVSRCGSAVKYLHSDNQPVTGVKTSEGGTPNVFPPADGVRCLHLYSHAKVEKGLVIETTREASALKNARDPV